MLFQSYDEGLFSVDELIGFAVQIALDEDTGQECRDICS